MSLKGVNIQKGYIGPNAIGGNTATSGLIVCGVGNDTLKLNTAYELNSIDDCAILGITPDYDSTNNVILYHHISEFFRMSDGKGKLFIMVCNTDASVMLGDAAKKLLANAKGAIRQIGVACKPVTADIITDGISIETRAAIAPAQALAKWAYNNNMPIQVLLEGRAYNGNPVSVIDLRALEIAPNVPLEADKVSIVIGQDWDYAEKMGGVFAKYAAIGTALGTLAGIAVNRNMGEVEKLNLSNAAQNKFAIGGLSNHQSIEDAYSQLETLDKKGYIFPITYNGISGYRWNNDHVCTPEKVDVEGRMNESSISYGRVIDDAVRRLRIALLPRVKSVQYVEKTTGKLPIGVVKSFEKLGDNEFDNMVTAGLITSGKTTVDPNSNILTGEKALKISFIVVPTGTINEIQGFINLKTSL